MVVVMNVDRVVTMPFEHAVLQSQFPVTRGKVCSVRIGGHPFSRRGNDGYAVQNNVVRQMPHDAHARLRVDDHIPKSNTL